MSRTFMEGMRRDEERGALKKMKRGKEAGFNRILIKQGCFCINRIVIGDLQ